MKKTQLAAGGFFLVLGAYLSLALAFNLHHLLSGSAKGFVLSLPLLLSGLLQIENIRLFFLLFNVGVICFIAYIYLTQNYLKYRSDMIWVTPDIQTPRADGQGQYGTARWLPKNQFKRAFHSVKINPHDPVICELMEHGYDDILDSTPMFKREKEARPGCKAIEKRLDAQLAADNPLEAEMQYQQEQSDRISTELHLEQAILESAGLYLGNIGKDHFFIGDDTHSITIGATRSGKSRTVALKTIVMQALAGESMINSDPKGELYLYTKPFLERLGYEVIAIDFDNPGKSDRYNFMQPVIDSIKAGDIPMAIERARDMAASMASCDRANEQIWVDGERAMLVSSLLAVAYDNKNRPEFQNLTNAYHFLGKMCKPRPPIGDILLRRYLEDIGPQHPAAATIDIAEIAPSKMRGSFFTSAMVTLDLFTDPRIYGMTCATDFDIYATGRKKRAIFIILPDGRSTYYRLASLFVYQQYQLLVAESKKNGNRLPIRVNFNLDEMGNFTKIPDMDKLITVGGGRGIRFNMYLQDFNQLDKVYGEKESRIIRSNAETWIYLQTDNGETLKELEAKLGQYTIKSPSLSASSGGQSSTSYNYTGRHLLTAEEIKRIRRPYQLVTSRNDPAIFYSPDLSETIFNQMLGLGNEKWNQWVMMERDARRPERRTSINDVKLWGIWDVYLGNAPLTHPVAQRRPSPPDSSLIYNNAPKRIDDL